MKTTGSEQERCSKSRSSDFIIRISSEPDEAIKGKVEHVVSGQVHFFNDFVELLMLIQNKLDEEGFPQSDTQLREFTSPRLVTGGQD